MGYRVAVVGATGNVGRDMLQILSEREFPIDEIAAIASERSAGREVSFGDNDVLKIQNLEGFDFSGFDIALFSPGSRVSAEHAPRAAKAGCVVIDNTSQFRLDPDVPLVVPEVNADAVADYRKRNIIANPKLFNDPDGRCPKAFARRGKDPAYRRGHLPVSVRCRQRRNGRAIRANQGDLRQRSDGA